MKRRLFSATFAIFMLARSATGWASIHCANSVKWPYVDADGSVVVYLVGYGDFVQVCNVGASWKAVPVSTCYPWFATINNAVTNGAQITITYDGVSSCSTIGSYGSAPAPVYVMYGTFP